MRSCEYSSVSGTRKTQLLTIKDVRFFRGNREIRHSRNMPLHKITNVSICFRRQKNNEKEAVITMHRTDHTLCPVRAWGTLIQRVLSYPGASLNSPVNLCYDPSSKLAPFQIKSSQILKHIRNTVTIMGPACLGFKAREIGTHSIRSSFAMLLHIQGISSEKIMLQGRWRSTAFLTYIRVQVTKFSSGLSNKMVTNQHFYNIPDIDYDVCRRDLIHEDFNPIRRQHLRLLQPGILAV